MTIRWITAAGSLGVLEERLTVSIPISAESDIGLVQYKIIAGQLPRGLRLEGSNIVGSPTEVVKFTESRFVIRASDSNDIEDRTFSISINGADEPIWITPGGFLKVGQGENYFILDNAYVDFQLDSYDPDVVAGDTLEYYLSPTGGELPPGLTLSRDGRIFGFTDPIFSVEISPGANGSYDAQNYDLLPLDIAEARSNGFDSYFYDNVLYDYNEPSQSPRRISRFYSFVIVVTDGLNESRRLFQIYVVTDEFLKADNTIVQVDTNVFRADNTSNRVPLWITESNLGKRRANNYITIYLDVYDPPSLSGLITYQLLPENPDGSPSILPSGMALDTFTGEIAGRVPYQPAVSKIFQFTIRALSLPPDLSNGNYPYRGEWRTGIVYQINDTIEYLGLIYISRQIHRNQIPLNNDNFWLLATSNSDKTFSIDIIGEIESSISWISDRDLGEIKTNQPSRLFVEASSQLYGGRVTYELVGGVLPPGLSLLSTGSIEGKVRQFADSDNLGLTRFFDRDSSGEDSSTFSRSFTTTFDGNTTSFDREFKFNIKAKDGANFAESIKEFVVKVIADTTKTFANIYIKSFQSKSKRLSWFDFITNSNIFVPEDIYRFGDTNFGIQTEMKVLVFAGIESVQAVKYVQAMSRNHYNKRLNFGDVKFAVAKNPLSQEIEYEAVYVDIVDELEKNGASVKQTVELSDRINSRVLVSYDAISVDSDVPLVSDRDHQRIFPNSFKNMRARIKDVGDRDREFLPLWMRSIQDEARFEPGYTKALILCYTKPGRSQGLISRIKFSGFDFKSIDFEADRYVIDILDGEIENKYLAFPQRGEKLP
jgi:hypothetical protein